MQTQTCLNLEKRIARSAINALLENGYAVTVYDGEAYTLKNSLDAKTILAAMFTTECDRLIAKNPKEEFANIGWIDFVYGNDGWDVISDYTVNLEGVLKETSELADKLAATY